MASWSIVVVSCYALEVSSPTWSTVVVVSYALVVFSSVWSTVVAVNYALVVYSSTLALYFTGFALVLCLRTNKAYQHYTDLANHPAPVPPSLHYSPVLFHGERLEATPWGGAMSRSVSWLTTRGSQTQTHQMDFILNSISHHAHWFTPSPFSITWTLFKPFWPSILGSVLLD